MKYKKKDQRILCKLEDSRVNRTVFLCHEAVIKVDCRDILNVNRNLNFGMHDPTRFSRKKIFFHKFTQIFFCSNFRSYFFNWFYSILQTYFL